MKALLPIYCRILGYVLLLFSVFIPFALYIYGALTDSNILLYKEMVKFLMMIGLLMIILAQIKNENEETESIRIGAMRNAFFLTVLLVFIGMVFRLAKDDLSGSSTSSFLMFMVMNVLCLEYGMKKSKVDKFFKR